MRSLGWYFCFLALGLSWAFPGLAFSSQAALGNPSLLGYQARASSFNHLQSTVYIELGETRELNQLLEDFDADLAAIRLLSSTRQNDLDSPDAQTALARLARWDTACQQLLDDFEDALLRPCIQGAAKQVEEVSLRALEAGGRVQAGSQLGFFHQPATRSSQPYLFWGGGVRAKGQGSGFFIGEGVNGRAIIEVRWQEESLLNLAPELSLSSLSVAFFEFQQLTFQYLYQPHELLDPARGAVTPEAGFVLATLDLLALAPEGEPPLLTDAEVLQLQQLATRLTNPQDPLFMAALSGELEFFPDALLVTQSSFVTQVAEVAHLHLDAALDVSSWLNWPSTWGQLDVGVRGNIFSVWAYHNLTSFNSTSLNQGKVEAVDRIVGDLRTQGQQRWLASMDAGFVWQKRPWQLGLTLYNLNQPSSRYPALSKFEEGVDAEAVDFLLALNRLQDAPSLTLSRYAVLELAAFSWEPRLIANAHYSFGTADHFVGWAQRSVGASVRWVPEWQWTPGIRLGWERNLVGSRLDYLQLDVELGRSAQVNLGLGFPTTRFDDWRLPRFIQLGFKASWGGR